LGVFDLMAVTKTLELARLYNKPAAVVLTFCPVRGKEIDDTEDALYQMGAEIVPVRIHNLIAYSRAQQTGLAVQEFEPG
jgi:chromosome partitioning protein